MSTTQKKLEELDRLIEGIETAMFTTRRHDGHLVSRPMATQKRDPIADLWFVTEVESEKVNELRQDPHVSLAYFDTGSWEWVSVSGTARISTDRESIRAVYQPDWKAWFPDEGDERHGTPDDPRIVLILVEAESVVYTKRENALATTFYDCRFDYVPTTGSTSAFTTFAVTSATTASLSVAMGGASALNTSVAEIVLGQSTAAGDIRIDESDNLTITSLHNTNGAISITAGTNFAGGRGNIAASIEGSHEDPLLWFQRDHTRIGARMRRCSVDRHHATVP